MKTRRGKKDVLYYIQGISILNVLAIHSRLFHGTYVFKHFINRAVSIFMVCFGVSSKLWCDIYIRKHENEDNDGKPNSFSSDATNINLYKNFIFGRVKRLYFPWWLTLVLWKILGVAHKSEYLFEISKLKPRKINWIYAFFLGYTPHLGASWFVTEIFLQIISFPVLHYFFMVNKNSTRNNNSNNIISLDLETLHLSIAIFCCSLSVYIPNNFLQKTKAIFGFQLSHIIWPTLFFGKVLFGSKILSNYIDSNDSYNLNSTAAESIIPMKYGVMSSIITLLGTIGHIQFLSSNPMDFDDKKPFIQVIRELIDIPLAYSMFWIVQCIISTIKINDTNTNTIDIDNGNDDNRILFFMNKRRIRIIFRNEIFKYMQQLLYLIGRNTWNIYLGHLILHNAIYFNYVPKLSFINRDKSRLLHFGLLLGSSMLFKKLIEILE
jgi:hypothetical protein